MDNPRSEFWDRLEDVTAGMLGLGDGQLMPMSPQLRDADEGKIWFISATGNALVKAVTTSPQPGRLVVTDEKEGLHADIKGNLFLSEEEDVIDDIWSSFAAAWFEDGKKDDDVRLLCFTPTSAEVWLTSDNPVKFFYEIAKANLTDETPDVGWQGTITF
ncbi:pyridoxamine 5'-phosphate oxidase family protein [Yoonia sp. 2307UL14-13]|uniref:pyridoxamine 5'-phosphate oxidase family protein n=1 Tax=Yoonia sp. 2307UL14-13 TaxID=3126506 RepID=UPI00309C86B5